MTVTITGANGFIGHHLVCDQLQKGRRVRAVDYYFDRLKSFQGHSLLEFIQADIRDTDQIRDAVTGVKVVFHLASAHLSLALSDDEYWKTNRDASRTLVELSHNSGVSRFIHCSSVGVHGRITTPPANEESQCEPDLVYEQSKLAGEMAVREYAMETGYSVVVVRPVWVYGPGCGRIEKLFKMIKKRRFFFVGNGETLRHCIHISDMIEAFNLCAKHPAAPGQVFIIGDHRAVTVRELVQEMANVVGVSAPRFSVPLWVANPICSVLEQSFRFMGKEPPLSKRSLKFFTNNTSFDIGKATREIGFQPGTRLQEGLRSTYEAIKQRTALEPVAMQAGKEGR
jgi:nucleoside-diphosphate-sugar epimerase